MLWFLQFFCGWPAKLALLLFFQYTELDSVTVLEQCTLNHTVTRYIDDVCSYFLPRELSLEQLVKLVQSSIWSLIVAARMS